MGDQITVRVQVEVASDKAIVCGTEDGNILEEEFLVMTVFFFFFWGGGFFMDFYY